MKQIGIDLALLETRIKQKSEKKVRSGNDEVPKDREGQSVVRYGVACLAPLDTGWRNAQQSDNCRGHITAFTAPQIRVRLAASRQTGVSAFTMNR